METPTVALLRVAYNELAAEIGSETSKVAPGIRPSHGSIMEQLDFTDGMRLTDLARGAGLTPQSAGELVDQLEDLGYVVRRPDPEDRRAKLIFRTSKAKRAAKTANDAARRIDVELQDLLGAKRYEQLRRDLTEIVEAR
jgi:DNA-binding MarR family transcriptional regulator